MPDHSQLYETARTLLAPKKGILAADQSAGTMDKQLLAIGAKADAETRRRYRQLLFTTEGIERYVSGIILYDATIRNQTDDGIPFIDVITAKGIIPIIKVDKSTTAHQGFPGEVVTEGLDGLGERLAEYYNLGARAAKWRAVFNISPEIPSEQNILFDTIQLARYAALAQANGIVPIVEPEVIYKGGHSLERAEAVTTAVLKKLFDILAWYRVDLGGLILKSSMVLAGSEYKEVTSASEVAAATIRTFRASVPEVVPGIVFLSGGQTPDQATENLNAIAKLEQSEDVLPWQLAFSFSRGIEAPVQAAWQGQEENVAVAKEALIERLKINCQADQGIYTPGET